MQNYYVCNLVFVLEIKKLKLKIMAAMVIDVEHARRVRTAVRNWRTRRLVVGL